MRCIGIALLGAVIAPDLVAQTEPAAPALFDLHVFVPVDRPLLVDVSRSIDCPIEVTVVGKTTRIPLRKKEEWRFVDVHSVLQEDEEACARQFLKAFATNDGRVDDPEINGLRVDFKRSDGWSFESADERLLSSERLEDMLAQADSVGLWVKLPDEARIGDKVDVELRDLMRLALDAGAELGSASAQLAVASVDGTANVALLTGKVACSQTETIPGGALKLAYDLDAELEIDLSERRIRRFQLKGKATASSAGLLHASGTGPVAITLVATTGDAAAAAMKSKPVFREVERRVEMAGVSFRAPSHWFDGGEEDEQVIFQRSFSDATGHARIAFARFRWKFDAKTLTEELRKTLQEPTIKPGNNPLGKGLAFSFEKDGVKILGEYCALDDSSVVLIRLLAPTSLFDDSLREFEAVKKSLKRLPKS